MGDKQLKLGAISSYVIIIVTALSGLIYTPFLLSNLGQSEYGLYMLIGSLVGYISILDFGLHNTIYRYIAKYQNENDNIGQENFLAIIFRIYAFITVLIILVGGVLYLNLESIFAGSLLEEELIKAKIMFAILVLNVSITLPIGAFQYIIKGHSKFIFVNIITILRIILRTGVIIGVLLIGYKSIAVVIIDTAFNIVIGGVYMLYCLTKLNVRIKAHDISKDIIKEVFNYSIFVFILAIVNQFFWKLGQVALGVLANTSAVALYALSISLVIYYQQIGLGISGLFIPKVTELVVRGASNDDLTDLMIKVGRIQLSLLGLALSGFIVLGKQFIYLWAGDSYSQVYLITLMIFIPLTLQMIQTIGSTVLKVRNLQSYKARLYLIMAGINLVLSIILGRRYGALGVGISTSISLFIFQVMAMNHYYHKYIGLNIKRFFIEVRTGLLPIIVGMIILGEIINIIPGSGWINFFSKGLLMASIYSILLFKYGLNKEEKALILNPIQKYICCKGRKTKDTI